jgi:hypothetical protein
MKDCSPKSLAEPGSKRRSFGGYNNPEPPTVVLSLEVAVSDFFFYDAQAAMCLETP